MALRDWMKPPGIPPATVATVEEESVGSVAGVAGVAGGNPESSKTRQAGEAPGFEARRQRVLALLADRPCARFAVLTTTAADRQAVLATLAIRGALPEGRIVTCELRIPREKYDPFLLFDLIERHGGTAH